MINPLNRAGVAIEDWLLEPIDARVYAIVRMFYGLVCFSIVVEVWPVRDQLFSDGGMSWHRPDLLFYIPLKYATSSGQVTAMMVAAAICSLMVAMGLFTRAMLVLLYFWNFSYCAIGYPAESGYDGIARIVGFLLIWAPTIRVWSLDERIFGKGESELPRYTLRLIQFQLGIIYVCTVWLKAPDAYWRSGELMSYFMMSMYSRFATWHWAEWGRASALMTWATLLAETAIPICLLINPRLRRLGFLLGAGLHGGIAFTSTIGMFSFAMVPMYLAFLQREDIDDAIGLLQRFKKKQGPQAMPIPAQVKDAPKPAAAKDVPKSETKRPSQAPAKG